MSDGRGLTHKDLIGTCEHDINLDALCLTCDREYVSSPSEREGVKLDEAWAGCADAACSAAGGHVSSCLVAALASERARADALERKVADCEAEHPPEPWAAELQARADAAEKALETYGRHAHACYEDPVYAVEDVHHRGSSYTSGLVKDCVCGLRAVLARGEKENR
jgi:hypothetical protein